MESARAFTVLLQAEFKCDLSRVHILVGLYEQVEGFVSGDRLDWAIICGGRLLVSVVELAVM